MSHYPVDSSKFCTAVAESLKGMGGSFGVLLCIFFSAAATELATTAATRDGGPKVDVATDVSVAFNAGLAAVMKYGGAKRGSCTMVDALIGAQDALRAADADAVVSNNSNHAQKTAQHLLEFVRSRVFQARLPASMNRAGISAGQRHLRHLGPRCKGRR